MNKLTIIGNLTKEPELRTTTSGINVCSFTVAVNRKHANADGSRDADFFDVVAWRERGEMCAKFLSKGRKVCVIGEVVLKTWEKDGKHGARMEVTADEVEFLSPRISDPETPPETKDEQTGFTQVDTDELPF